MTNDDGSQGPSQDPSSAVHPVNGQIEPSTTPIQDRLKKAYIDKFNTLMVSGMTHEQVKYHIADIEDSIKLLQTQLQATLDVDDEWSTALSVTERETLRAKDKKYRAIARPPMNADGTIKTTVQRAPKEVKIGDPGTQAFENLVEKLIKSGLTRENAVKLLQTGGK